MTDRKSQHYDLLVHLRQATRDGLADPRIPVIDEPFQAKHDDPFKTSSIFAVRYAG